jgi:ATP-dependent RNA helicase DbpA
VGTPGRVLDHLQRGSLNLDALSTLVLDEADRMLEMGFADEINAIGKLCPRQRQTLLFSATYPEGINQLAAAFMREPREVRLAAEAGPPRIRQVFFEVTEEQRLHAVGQLLDHHRPVSTLAFCNTKQQCRDLVAVLRAQGFAAMELHGDLDQRERDQVLVCFSNRSLSVLVATDIAARGLDIAELEAVINVDISPDAATHTHRIGRTGRLGKGGEESGWAFSLASLDEMGRVGAIEQMRTLQILGGRKEKIRAGDVLGALTKDMGFAGADVGRISVNEFSTYVAVSVHIAQAAERKLGGGKVKGRSVKVRLLPA